MQGSAIEITSTKRLGKLLGVGKFGWRLVLALLFTVSLCLFIQLRENKVDVLEIHSVSKQYIVAQASFEVPDE